MSSLSFAVRNKSIAVRYCLFLDPFGRLRPRFIGWSAIIVPSAKGLTIIVMSGGVSYRMGVLSSWAVVFSSL